MPLISAILYLILVTAPPADEKARDVVEFRLLSGSMQPHMLELGKNTTVEEGTTVAIPEVDEPFFDGIIINLKPTLAKDGNIAYTGDITINDFAGFVENEPGKLEPVLTTETVKLDGDTGNHQAVGVRFQLLEKTVYFVMGDPKRPLRDCPACGPKKDQPKAPAK